MRNNTRYKRKLEKLCPKTWQSFIVDKRIRGFTVSEANGADRREERLLDDAWACAKVLLAAKRGE